MAQETIGIGSAANDGTGDTLRAAGTKINANFTELYARRLDQWAAPTVSVSFGTQRITNLADPSAAQDAATKAYVDAVAQGLDPKGSVKCATTANITLSGEQTIDGVTTSASRVLVKNQSAASQNGIYVSAAGIWSRATDADAWTEIPGAYCFVEEGSTLADTGWVCTSNVGGTLGSTAVTWVQFSGAGSYTVGTGLTLTGTQFSIDTTVVARFTSRLDQFAAPTADVSFGSNKITNLADPASSHDAATKAYVDAVAPNLVDNGNFGVNQRGVSGTVTLAVGAFGHDRWKAGAGGCTYTFVTSGLDTTITITSGTLCQTIPGRAIVGGVYAASWVGTAQARVYQGAASGAYAASGFTTASLSAATNTTIEFGTGTLTRVQVKPGTLVTAFDRRDNELSRCQRYFYRWSAGQYARFGLGYCDQTTTTHVVITLPSAMDGVPTVTTTNMTANGASVTDSSVGGYSSGVIDIVFTSSGMSVGAMAQIYVAPGQTGVIDISSEI